MRLSVKIILLILLTLFIGNAVAKKAKDTAPKGKARLEKYDIPYTEESFFKYLHLDNGEVIRDFLDAGYDPNIRDDKHDPVLLVAAENDYYAIAKVLLEKGADPELGDYDGSTPLMYAGYNQNTRIVKLLLKHKANVNAQNRAGSTALMFAIKGGNGSTIDELLTKATDLNLKNEKGETAKDLALSFKYLHLADYMEDKVDFLNGRYIGKERFSTIKLRDL